MDHFPQAVLNPLKSFHAAGEWFWRKIAVLIILIIAQIDSRVSKDHHLGGAIRRNAVDQMLHERMIGNRALPSGKNKHYIV